MTKEERIYVKEIANLRAHIAELELIARIRDRNERILLSADSQSKLREACAFDLAKQTAQAKRGLTLPACPIASLEKNSL